MKKNLRLLMLFLLSLLGGVNLWAQDVETIANFLASEYYSNPTSSAWAVNGDYATANNGYYKLVASTNYIKTPSINWNLYEDLTITIGARKFNGPNETEGKISVSQGSTELAFYSPTGTSIGSSGELDIEPTGTGVITISCPGASGSKGCGVHSVVIKGKLKSGAVAAPIFNPVSGTAVQSGDKVTITVAEGCTLSYTVNDGSTQTASGTSVEVEITEDPTTIVATATKNGISQSATANYTLFVPIPTDNYVKVTNSNQLVAGNKYILVGSNNSSSAAMGKREGTNTYRERVFVTIESDKVAVKQDGSDGIAVLTLGGESNAWTFTASDNNEYLALTIDDNKLHSSAVLNDNTKWIVTNDFQLRNVSFDSRYLQYNSGSSRFACYQGTQIDAVLYVKEGSPINDKTPADLEFSSTTATATIGESFTAPTLTNPYELEVIYSSSNTAAATVNQTTGEVTLVAAGKTTITASFAGNGTYEEGSASYTLTVIDPNAPGGENNPYTVEEALEVIEDLGSASSDFVYVSGIISEIKSTSVSSGTLTYYISDDGTTTSQLQVYKGKGLNNANFEYLEDIAVGDEVTVYGQLKKYQSTPEFDSGNYLVKLIHNTTPPVTVINPPSIDVPSGTITAGTNVTISADEGLWISYTTDGTDPTTTTVEQWVTANEAVVIINNSCTLKAIAIDPNELEKSEVVQATYTISNGETVVFQLVTDASSLNEGDEIIFVGQHDTNLFGMGGLASSGNNFVGVSLDLQASEGSFPSTLPLNNDVQVLTLEGSSSGWYFNLGGGKYLYAASSSSNQLKITSDKIDDAKATISISDNKYHHAAIIFQGNNTRNHLKFNHNNEIFSCYAESNSMNFVKIYRKTIVPPTPTENVIWMTYCSTSDLDFTDCTTLKAYTVFGYQKPDALLARIYQVPAKTGIMIKAADDTSNVSDLLADELNHNHLTPKGTITGEFVNFLVGVTTSTRLYETGTMTVDGEEVDCYNFVLAKKDGQVGFYKSSGNGNIGANKAYLQLPQDLFAEGSANGISFAIDGEETAIKNVNTRTNSDDAWYTLQGVRVAQPNQSGIYIRNGQKVVVK